MIKNYLKIAFRNLWKNPLLGFLNIFGLAVGIAFTMLIFNYVWGEFSVNGSLKNAENQFIIQSNWTDKNEGSEIATFGPLAKELKEQYPQLIANYYRYDGVTAGVSIGDKNFRESIQIGDSTLLHMYDLKLLAGDSKAALVEPFTVVLTEEKALKFFGNTNVLGQSIRMESFSGSKHDFKVTGVLATFYKNSVTSLTEDFTTGLYVNTSNLEFFGRDMDWSNPYIVNFIELESNVSPASVQNAILALTKKNAPEMNQRMEPYLSSLKDYYLNANNGLIQRMIKALSAISIFILLMALVNFINLSISKSSNRMKEIGLRKYLGSERKQLVSLFLAESLIQVTISMLISFILYWFSKDYFGEIVDSKLMSLADLPILFGFIMVLSIPILAFLAGWYPAFVLSSMKAVETIKGKLPNIKTNTLFRKSLVIFQFSLAIMALIAAFVISQQIDLFLNKDLGYNKNRVVSAQVPRDWSRAGSQQMLSVRNQLATLPEIASVSLSYEIPNGNNGGSAPVYNYGADSTETVAAQVLRADEKFLSVYQIPMKFGENFEGNGRDSSYILINETASQALGYSSAIEAVGKKVRLVDDPTIFVIKGICNDFHFGSKQQKMAPIVIFNVEFSPFYRFLTFKLKPGAIAPKIEDLENKWAEVLPGAAFEYTFMDDSLAKMYAHELQLKKAVIIAAWLSLLIVILGMVAIISSNVQKRIKEIGIRKVLGSSVPSIILLFLKEFLIITLYAGLISSPVAYWLLDKWLSTYAYQIEMDIVPFISSIAILSVISIVLIGFQTYKSAIANPVRSLRSE